MSTDIDYSIVSHETIYCQITGGRGSATLEEVSRSWQSIAAKLEELHGRVGDAVDGIGAAQQGAAAEAATRATMALLPWLADTLTAATEMAARVAEQAALFSYTRDAMPTPRVMPEVSFRQDPGTWTTDQSPAWLPGIYTEHERALVAAQQDEQRARELMSGYQAASNANLLLHQRFLPAPKVVAELAPPAPGSVGDGGGVGLGGGGAQGGWRPHPNPAQLVSGGHQGSAPASTVAQLAGGYPSLGEDPTAGSGAFQPAGVAPSPIVASSAVAGGDRVRGRSRFSGAGEVSRDGGFGPRPRAAVNSRPGASRLGGPPGQHSTPQHSTPQSSTAQDSAAQHRAGRAAGEDAGWAGAALGAPGGVGRAALPERRRPSYLIEQDTSAIVGELPPVAPPVIGADEDYR
ncbi:MAG: PPE domain-containing protein [Pseudonocardiales bacterium]|nr:PPE domain-containing protein [Pseudonocardiales bacterium]